MRKDFVLGTAAPVPGRVHMEDYTTVGFRRRTRLSLRQYHPVQRTAPS